MNEFIEQFVIEGRELVEQGTRDLLTLEANASDKESLDSAFRVFHTLKGSAGIVDFAAMARALHATEDVLAAVRSGDGLITTQLVSDCLTCLDQVVQWLDYVERTEQIPPDADAAADTIVRRFAIEALPTDNAPATPQAQSDSGDWLEALLARHPAERDQAKSAIRYTPDPDCFFRDEDPLALIAGIQGVLAVETASVASSPTLNDFDPFTCVLSFLVLASSPPEAIEPLFHNVAGRVDIHALMPVDRPTAEGPALSPHARGLLDAQILLLTNSEPGGVTGRIASAGKVAANVLRHGGRDEAADHIERALAKSQASGDQGLLAAAIRDALAGVAGPAGEEMKSVASPVNEAAARFLRVDVERIDALVNLTGELTIAKNAIEHSSDLAREHADPKVLAAALKEQHAVLARLVNELQATVLSLRVLPMRNLFQRFPRLVRDIAATLGKPVALMTDGDSTEADKAIVEALFEPILHVLRNAIDHGVENARERTAAGKPATATIQLRAERRGEHVIIEIEDDGRGIDIARVREVAIARRMASEDTLAAMSDDELTNLIFAPGFSTTTEVTKLSGRGVGMDVVRTTIERLGGRVGVASRPGLGTTVRFTMPFTVMMTRVMTVEAAGQIFGIPLDAIVETVRVARDQVVPLGAGRAFVLRDRTTPLISLTEILGQEPDAIDTHNQEATIVVASMGGHLAGLEVQRLGRRMEIMLKPMEGLLAGMQGIAGTTLLGDGRVLIVLDLQDLIE